MKLRDLTLVTNLRAERAALRELRRAANECSPRDVKGLTIYWGGKELHGVIELIGAESLKQLVVTECDEKLVALDKRLEDLGVEVPGGGEYP